MRRAVGAGRRLLRAETLPLTGVSHAGGASLRFRRVCAPAPGTRCRAVVPLSVVSRSPTAGSGVGIAGPAGTRQVPRAWAEAAAKVRSAPTWRSRSARPDRRHPVRKPARSRNPSRSPRSLDATATANRRLHRKSARTPRLFWPVSFPNTAAPLGGGGAAYGAAQRPPVHARQPLPVARARSGAASGRVAGTRPAHQAAPEPRGGAAVEANGPRDLRCRPKWARATALPL